LTKYHSCWRASYDSKIQLKELGGSRRIVWQFVIYESKDNDSNTTLLLPAVAVAASDRCCVVHDKM
jgi:hypothetical protein